jgi:hypothetical protein
LNNNKIQKILEDIDIPLEDEIFLQKVFSAIGDEYDSLSQDADYSSLQESCSIRNILRTRALANLLISDEGKFNDALLPKVISELEQALYSLGPNREHDAKRNELTLKMLKRLQADKTLGRALTRIGKPHMHKFADQIIRETLQLPPKTVVTDAYARRAALSALLCYLRQNVGSCFATAPAILVHDEQPEVFLNDLQELLSTGRLKRTFGGVEYAVPLSTSSGTGDLKRKFPIYGGPLLDEMKLWKSPGLIAAFESIELIHTKIPKKKKQEQCRSFIINALKSKAANKEFLWISVEEIIDAVLLQHYSITDKEIKEYEERPKGAIHSGFLMQAPLSGSSLGEKTHKFDVYLTQVELAKSVFKGLADNALLKSWEFSLASFSETKSQFTRWNLYSSLGVNSQDDGGIGPCLIEILQRALNDCNEKLQEHQAEYEMLYNQLQYVQRKFKNSASEQEAKWNRIEYQTKMNEFNLQEELRNKYHAKGQRYANLYDQLINLYDRLFPRYFQEVYDADIHQVTAGPYDDSPAGFRLLYKHGRSNTSQWTKIENHIDFIDALANFFTATESEIDGSPEMKDFQEDLSQITTALVTHVRSKRFLETAFTRMAIAHRSVIIENPLENLEKIEKKPWVYTSGGSMNTLVSCYFRRNEKPTESSRWVEDPMELLVFFIDCIKEMPDTAREPFEMNPEKSLLVHSPTHAFLLKPGYVPFADAWRNKEFTYTWVRDNHVRNMEQFSKKIYLDDEKMKFILERLQLKVPLNYRYYFKEVFNSLGGSLSAKDFRRHIIDTIETTPGLLYKRNPVLTASEIDATLYDLLPIFPSYKLRDLILKMISDLPGLQQEEKDRMLHIFEEHSGKILAPKLITSKGLIAIIKSLIMLVKGKNTSSFDYHKLLINTAQKNECAFPAPIIIADTNWVKDYFAFVVNPGTGKLEFWRTDYTGSTGAPMDVWDQWLNGSAKEPTWGLYTRSLEYKF